MAPLNRDSVMGRSICDKQPVHVPICKARTMIFRSAESMRSGMDIEPRSPCR